MKRSAVLMLMLIAAAVATAVIPARAGASNPRDHRVTLVAHNDEGQMTPSDFFANLTQNAQASIDAPIYHNGVAAGMAETILTVTRRAGDDIALMVECSIELADGNIFFNGSAHVAELVGGGAAIPVIGGTGRYSGARGTVVLTATNHDRPVLVFDFTTK